jgi:hypothetical protein
MLPPKAFLVLQDFGANLSFNKHGEQVFLFSANASGDLTGWLHGFDFSAAEPGSSFGRFVNSIGKETFLAQTSPTLGLPNAGPRIGPVVVNSVMVGPRENEPGLVMEIGQYIELRNTSQTPVALFGPSQPTNTWQLRGSVDFDFPPGTMLAANSSLLVVGFDPESSPVAVAQFNSLYGDHAGAQLFGPWRGQIGGGESVVKLWKLETLGTEDARPSKVLVEQVVFTDQPPWPLDVYGTGLALKRRNLSMIADDPLNWMAALPTPGRLDQDGDGLPDDWESSVQLDPTASSSDNGAAGDPDHDGLSNRAEYLAGTQPGDPSSRLQLAVRNLGGGKVELAWATAIGHEYTIEYTDSIAAPAWHVLQRVTLPANGSPASLADTVGTRVRFYRVRSP